MVWMILIAVVVIAGFAVPRFGAAFIVLLCVGAVLIYGFDRRADAERAASRTRIGVGDLEFVDVVLQPRYSDHRLVGRLRNLSTEHSLSTLRLRIFVRDCGSADLRFYTLVEELRTADAAKDSVVARERAREIRHLMAAIPSRRPSDRTVEWRPSPVHAACEIVDEYEKTIYPRIPPGQARDMAESVYLSLRRPDHEYQWHYEIDEIVAR
jgi:hypothetical protein